ncbi:MAG: CPBP family intramembrane glutamic endopeptidase [Candidatus Dependentiae bacterium]
MKKPLFLLAIMFVYTNAYSASGENTLEKNWMQKAGTFCAKHPIDIALGAFALAAGSYALASPSSAVEKLEKLSNYRLILNASAFAGGCYSLGFITNAMLGQEHRLPSVSETIKKDLLGSQQAIGKTHQKPSVLTSLGHAGRFALYNMALHAGLTGLTPALFHEQNESASKQICLRISPIKFILLAPLIEEIIFTYVPHIICRNTINKKYAQFVMPFVFGLGHIQYNYIGMLSCACTNFLNHRSLIAHPEHAATPYLNHAINNALAL